MPPDPRPAPDDADLTLLSSLLLADGRFPSGAHAHSGGLEAAVAAGLVTDLADLDAWVTGCLHGTWLLEAAVAVAAAAAIPLTGGRRRRSGRRVRGTLARLDAELEARTTAPLQRRAARTLGRQLVRAAAAAFPTAPVDALQRTHPDGPAVPIAFGVLAAEAGLAGTAVATTWLHLAVQGATSAAVRLLGLDPYAVLAATVAARGSVAEAAAAAVAAAAGDPADLPAPSAPMLDVLLAAHETRQGRLFAT